VHGRNLNARDLARAPTANFSVGYSKSLTVGVKKKKNIPLCHVAHELTSRTYGGKKWWVVIVKDQTGFSRRETCCVRAGSRQAASQFLNPVSINLKKLPQMPANRFLKIVQETGQNSSLQFLLASFYFPEPPCIVPTWLFC